MNQGRLFDFAGYRIKLAYSLVCQSFNEMFADLEQHDRQLLVCLTEPERVTLKSLLGRLVKDLPAARESP